MLVLDQGLFASYSCGQRMGAMFLIAVVVQLLFLARSLGAIYWPDGGIETLSDGNGIAFTRRDWIAFGLWTALVTLVAIACMISPTRTLLSMDRDFIMETSCRGPFTFEYKLDRAKTEVSYHIEVSLSRILSFASLARGHIHSGGGRGEDNYLELKETDKGIELFVELDGNQNLKNLTELSPTTVQSYLQHKHGTTTNGIATH